MVKPSVITVAKNSVVILSIAPKHYRQAFVINIVPVTYHGVHVTGAGINLGTTLTPPVEIWIVNPALITIPCSI